MSPELTIRIADLLTQARFSKEPLVIERCSMGGNNRTYRVETPDGVFAIKEYFTHSTDSRDRLHSEFAFLSFAANVVGAMVPKPYAHNPRDQIALYEFIEGWPIQENGVTEREVNAAIHFFRQLNAPELRKQAVTLPNASEACFSIQEHFDLIAARIRQVQQISPDTEERKTAQQYAEQLNHFWLDLVDQTKELAQNESFDLTFALPVEQRCLSPSDFGFHNALKTIDGQIFFIDFEYAGWDDPGKMVGDFFAQIAVPVPEKFFEPFIHKTMVLFPGPENLIRRARILRPAYQVKWCCIALNVFLPHHLARRKFANEHLDVVALQRSQLLKVERLMKLLKPLSMASEYGL